MAAPDATEDDWRLLLTVSARMPPPGCLAMEDADALVAWAADRPGWRGARAEWLAVRGKAPEADALLATPGEDGARLRVALTKGDGDAARLAAEGALVEEPRDVLACRLLGSAALEEGDAAWAIELSDCGGLGARAPDLQRLRGDALDRAGEHAAALATYAKVGVTIHRAAILYQESPTPERVAEARALLAAKDGERPPPAALHAAWMALVAGEEASIEGLDHSIPAKLARAMVRGAPEDVAAIAEIPGAPAAIVRARLAAERGDRAAMERALDEALAAAPAAEPVHRARVALRGLTGGDVAGALADWEAQDPDHVALVGGRGSRDVPWAALVPETWEALAARHPDPRMRADAPRGVDAVGDRARAARALPDAGERADALAALAKEVPGLDALPAERYRLGPPPAGVPDREP